MKTRLGVESVEPENRVCGSSPHLNVITAKADSSSLTGNHLSDCDIPATESGSSDQKATIQTRKDALAVPRLWFVWVAPNEKGPVEQHSARHYMARSERFELPTIWFANTK